eukprot:998785-Prorocentrum_lima.AAC.1
MMLLRTGSWRRGSNRLEQTCRRFFLQDLFFRRQAVDASAYMRATEAMKQRQLVSIAARSGSICRRRGGWVPATRRPC